MGKEAKSRKEPERLHAPPYDNSIGVNCRICIHVNITLNVNLSSINNVSIEVLKVRLSKKYMYFWVKKGSNFCDIWGFW